MFTTTFVPNPNHTPGSKVATHVSVTVCDCGASDVQKRYTNDFSGEVDGVTMTCRSCGASETF